MDWQLLYIAAVVLLAPASLVPGLYALKLRRNAAAVPFAAMSVSVALMLAATALTVLSRSEGAFRLWSFVRFVPLTAAVACFFGFAVRYSGRRRWLTRGRMVALFAVPAVTTILAVTSPLHGLFIVETVSVPMVLLRVQAEIQFGPLFVIHAAYSYALGIAGIAIVIGVAIRRLRDQRYEAIFLVLATLPPLLAFSLGTFASGVAVPLGPIGLGAMNVLFAAAVFRRRTSPYDPPKES